MEEAVEGGGLVKMRSTGYKTAIKRELVRLDCKKSIRFVHFFQVRGQIVLITRSKGRQRENESRELGEGGKREGVAGR